MESQDGQKLGVVGKKLPLYTIPPLNLLFNMGLGKPVKEGNLSLPDYRIYSKVVRQRGKEALRQRPQDRSGNESKEWPSSEPRPRRAQLQGLCLVGKTSLHLAS